MGSRYGFDLPGTVAGSFGRDNEHLGSITDIYFLAGIIGSFSRKTLLHGVYFDDLVTSCNAENIDHLF